MTERDFETMLRFKAGAGIVPLCRWVRELRSDYERKVADASRRSGRSALIAVEMRLKAFNADGLRDEQKRWLEHTREIAKAALDGTNDTASEMVGGAQ